jgi:hypothetical protein
VSCSQSPTKTTEQDEFPIDTTAHDTKNPIDAKDQEPKKEINEHSAIVYGALGTYATPPRAADKTVDLEKLIKELKDIRANTYHWLIRDNNDGLDVVEKFLPIARRENINVWVTIVPPSEQPPRTANGVGYAEPYRLDFEKWAEELARLSLAEKNLVAWSIDDFVHNLDFFTPEYMEKIIKASKDVNPGLLFIPCCYYRQTTEEFADKYVRFFDGILFPYRAESDGANLQNPHLVGVEIKELRKRLKVNIPIILDIYATAHSKLGASSADYVKVALDNGLKAADGVLIYTHQDPVKSAEKYNIIRIGFTNHWLGDN